MAYYSGNLNSYNSSNYIMDKQKPIKMANVINYVPSDKLGNTIKKKHNGFNKKLVKWNIAMEGEG